MQPSSFAINILSLPSLFYLNYFSRNRYTQLIFSHICPLYKLNLLEDQTCPEYAENRFISKQGKLHVQQGRLPGYRTAIDEVRTKITSRLE